MSKLTAAAANIRATALGGLRTGLSGMRDTTPSPVTIYIGGGPTNMPATLDGIAPVKHPEPSTTNPTEAKCAAIRAQVAARAAAARATKRRAAKPATGPVLRKLPKGTFARDHALKLCAKLANGAPHAVKVVQARTDINGGPAFNVFLKLEPGKRGKHVITLYANHPIR
jgi:hypothetical protein